MPCGAHDPLRFFRHPRRGLVRKTVIFFLAQTDRQKVLLSEEHVGYEWVPEDKVLSRLEYPTARQVFQAGLRFLSHRTDPPRHST